MRLQYITSNPNIFMKFHSKQLKLFIFHCTKLPILLLICNRTAASLSHRFVFKNWFYTSGLYLRYSDPVCNDSILIIFPISAVAPSWAILQRVRERCNLKSKCYAQISTDWKVYLLYQVIVWQKMSFIFFGKELNSELLGYTMLCLSIYWFWLLDIPYFRTDVINDIAKWLPDSEHEFLICDTSVSRM